MPNKVVNSPTLLDAFIAGARAIVYEIKKGGSVFAPPAIDLDEAFDEWWDKWRKGEVGNLND